MLRPPNPVVFLDVMIGSFFAGRVVLELFADTNPFTVENFRCLCTGEKGTGMSGKPLHFKGTHFHRLAHDLVQGGDITAMDGTGGEAVYPGGVFNDEAPIHRHNREGLLGMASFGRHMNTSQFYITLTPLPHLDAEHVVFGQVIEGYEIVMQMSKSGSGIGMARVPVKIHDCGEIRLANGRVS